MSKSLFLVTILLCMVACFAACFFFFFHGMLYTHYIPLKCLDLTRQANQKFRIIFIINSFSKIKEKVKQQQIFNIMSMGIFENRTAISFKGEHSDHLSGSLLTIYIALMS